MKKNRWLLAITALALIAGACANNEPEASSETTASESSEVTEAPTSDDGSETTEAMDDMAEVPSGPYEHLNRALAGEFDGTEVTIQGQWVEAEEDGFNAALAGFAAETGIDIKYEGVSDHETVLNVKVNAGDAPDLAQIAQPGAMRSYVEQGQLVNLSEWMNTDQLASDYIESFLNLGSVDGNIYGIFYKADIKSIVWYPVQAFADNGYEIPTTWDELTALSDQIIADGNGNPWCLSIEHGDVSGWVATDWMEDVLLRTASPEVYDKWVNHEIPFNDPEVLEAAAVVSDVFFQEDYVYGGNTGINSIWVGDTQTPMFAADGPECWLHKQAAWIPGFWPTDDNDEPLYEPGVDSSFFYLPPIESEFGSPVLGGGDQFVMFNDRPEVRAVLEFIATPEGAKGWVEAGGFLSPNKSVPTDWYTSYPQTDLAVILTEATVFRFDASDTMPKEVGAGTFWTGMVDWIAANGENTDEVFADIEASWPAE